MYKNVCVIILSLFVLCSSDFRRKKYILYDVNPGEGFNLRRDVFMRVAVLVRKLNLIQSNTHFVLVLPPWGNLYHWQSRNIGAQTRLPWSLFFDTSSIYKFVPVIELSDYLNLEGNVIDTVYYLQGYAGGWKDGKFEEKFDEADCLEPPPYRQEQENKGLWRGYFWDFKEIRARRFKCLSLQGTTSVLQQFLIKSEDKSIMLDRAETLLHDYFGDVNYWGVRRSMRFAHHLVKIANVFRFTELDSSDVTDKTLVHADWRNHRVERQERGGPYLCVHLRRKDYVRARPGQIPDIPGAADQLKKLSQELNLKTIFVSTDAPREEFEKLKDELTELKVVKYTPEDSVVKVYKDGGVAVIDQIICSHARYFIGSYESTFTFRIQEEREIMGFPTKSTFDMLCPSGKERCEKGSQWKIDWGPSNQDWSLPVKLDHSEL